ncbi:ATPase [Pediococcus damnosus]|nr:ATPase [Pediococcus damnosus]
MNRFQKIWGGDSLSVKRPKTNRERVIESLKTLSLALLDNNELGVSANTIAKKIDIQRSTVSLYLNELVRNKEAIKINTRPVYFLDANIYQNNKDKLSRITEYIENKETEQGNQDPFDELVGSDGSLKDVVDQIKSAVIYPPRGLSTLLVGESGVGKSFIAQLAYKFAQQKGLVKGKWIVLNCAEYADNPELLSSILFGNVKGAFTGADTDKSGLLKAAEDGYLFLDEVHRLTPENQEKLFQYMDKGTYRRVGETDQVHTSNARLIFATTEKQNADFLQTFLRRIPLVIQIPNFQERTRKERIDLITMLFFKEAKTIQHNLYIASEVVQVLIQNVNKGNVGKLASIVKLSCAEALLRAGSGEKDIHIKLDSLPHDFLRTTSVQDISTTKDYKIQIHFKSEQIKSRNTIERDHLYQFADKLIQNVLQYGSNKISKQEFYNQVGNVANGVIDYISFELRRIKTNAFSEYVEQTLKSILANLYVNIGISQFNSSANLLTKLIIYVNDYEDDQEIENLDQTILILKQKFSDEMKLTDRVVTAIKKQFDVHNTSLYQILVFAFIYSQNQKMVDRETNAVIITHGYSTAESLASTVNRLLGSYVYESFDMPLDASVDDIIREIKAYFKTVDIEKPLVILVDMGSLKALDQRLKKIYSGAIAIISGVSTEIALDIGNKVLQNNIDEDVLKRSAREAAPKITTVEPVKRKNVILTTCITGIGAATYLQKLIQDNTHGEITVISKDFYELKKNGIKDSVFNKYRVKIIVGTDDPSIPEIPYLSVEGLINRDVGDPVFLTAFPDVFTNASLKSMNDSIVRAFTVDNIANNMTALDPAVTVSQVEGCVTKLERSLGTKMDVYLKISLYMHLCFMFERVVQGEPNLDYHNVDHFRQCYGRFIEITEDALSDMQHYYSVKIPVSEIGFIFDILKNRVDLSNIE